MLCVDSLQKRVGHLIQASCRFRFHYITCIEGRRFENLKTLVQPTLRFSLCFDSLSSLSAPTTPSASPIQTPPRTNAHYTRGLCCLSMVGWLRNLLTRIFSQGLPGCKQRVRERLDRLGWTFRLCIMNMYTHICALGCKVWFTVYHWKPWFLPIFQRPLLTDGN